MSIDEENRGLLNISSNPDIKIGSDLDVKGGTTTPPGMPEGDPLSLPEAKDTDLSYYQPESLHDEN